MGTYIGMGMACHYVIPKKELAESLKMEFIRDKSEDDIKKEIRKIFPEDLYDLGENEYCYYFTLSDNVSVNDVIAIYDEFNKISNRDSSDMEYINEHRRNLMQMKTINEVLEYADEETLHFLGYELPSYFYYEPHSLFDKIVCISMSVSIIVFYFGNGKTRSEFRLESFDIFTHLLRYRMKGLKLADTMFVFLSV